MEGRRTPGWSFTQRWKKMTGFVDAGDRIQPSHLLSTIHPSSRNQAGVSRAWISSLGGHRPALRLPAPVPSLRGAGRTDPGGDSLEMTPHPSERRIQLRQGQLSQEKLHASFSLPGKAGLSWTTGRRRNAHQLSRQYLPRVTSDTRPCQTVGQRDVQAATDVQDLMLIAGQAGEERRKPKPRI